IGTLQAVLGATAAPTQLVAPMANELAFVPEIDTDETRRVSVPPLVSINAGVAKVTPTRWFPNGTMLVAGITGATPVPAIGTALNDPVTGLPTSTTADCPPVVVGA